MLAISCVVALLVTLIHASQGFYFGNDVGVGRAPMCATPHKPCRLLISVGTFGGATVESNGVQTCTCSTSNQCPDDWNLRGHVVSRKVVSTTFNITLQMMFCRPVEPPRLCGPGDVSIELKGSMHLPQDITAFNCRCNRRAPLVLAERTFGEDYMMHHSYICANHMRVCSQRDPCMTMSDFNIRYSCQCRDGLQCRAQRGQTEAYCQP